MNDGLAANLEKTWKSLTVITSGNFASSARKLGCGIYCLSWNQVLAHL